jgi:hypothetical protein
MNTPPGPGGQFFRCRQGVSFHVPLTRTRAMPRRSNPGMRPTVSYQHPVLARSVRQASCKRAGDSRVIRRRNAVRGNVWMLSKLTTQSLGIWSSAAVSSNSDTRPLRVRVSATTTTAPMRSATGSLVRTRTGRSPPGVAANHSSPRRIGPVSPVLRRPPIGDLS